MDFKLYTSLECFVEGIGEVCGENADAIVRFEALKQIVDFDIGVTIVGCFDVCTFGKEGIGFVKNLLNFVSDYYLS